MKPFLLLISLFLTVALCACDFYPSQGEHTRCSMNIDFRRSYLSGICVMHNDGKKVRGAMFNEFGISVVGFSYNERRNRTKIENVMAMLDKWYIRWRLKKDLTQIMLKLRQGNCYYKDEKFGIICTFSELKEENNEITE